MARCRRSSSSLSFLWMIIHLSLVSGNTIQLDNTRRGATIDNQSKGLSRKRRLSSSGKGSKKSNFWYRGFYSHSTESSPSSQSSQSSSRSGSYDIQIQVLFPDKPDGHDETMQPQTPSPSRLPTKMPTKAPTKIPTKLPTKSPTPRPTSSPTSEPSIRPTPRPTPSPTPNPTSLRSESPTILAPSQSPSTNPSAIASESPTLSPAPSSSPSSEPSALASSGPTLSIAPSHLPSSSPSSAPSVTPSATPSNMPSMVASRGPSSAPSNAPSAIDSDQPTLSLSPSIAPSTMPSTVASGSPSASVRPTLMPTLTQSEGPSNIPSTIPSMMPSSDPSMGPSTTPPFETAAPTIERDVQRLPVFTLEYQLFDFEDPTESDLVELEGLTRAYLRDHIFGAIDDADALLDDFFTTYTDEQTDSGALVINVSFESTAFYNANSPTTIPMDDLIEEVVNAFTGEELDEYLERVQSLPNSNTFAGAIQVFLISQLESQNQRSLFSILLSGSAAALVSILGGYGLIRYRRRTSARRQASKKFLEIVSKDSTTDCSSFQGNFKNVKTDSSILSTQEGGSNPFENSNDVWDQSEAHDFLAEKRSTYSRPRMHKFSND